MTQQMGTEGFRWFAGVVADILDPEQLGRVRVRIFGLHDDTNMLANDDLPWAQVLVSPTSASTAGVGITPVGLAPDSYVIGFFADGNNAQFPIILGSFHKMPKKDPNYNDVNVLARGTNKLQKEAIGPEPGSAYNAQYPKNQVFESKSGHIIEIDDTDGSERIHIYHRAGTYIEIDQGGRLVIKSTGSSIDVAGADKDIFAQGSINIVSEADIKLTAKDTIELDAPVVSIKGSTSQVTVSEGFVDIKGSDTRIKGEYLNVDTPESTISGTSFSGGTISTTTVQSSKVTTSSLVSKATTGLTSAVKEITNGFKLLSNYLSDVTDLDQLKGLLDTVSVVTVNSLTGITHKMGGGESPESMVAELDQLDSKLETANKTRTDKNAAMTAKAVAIEEKLKD